MVILLYDERGLPYEQSLLSYQRIRKRWSMNKIGFFIVFAALCLIGCSSQTLDQAIQNEWESPVAIVMTEDTKHGVIFKENDQYIFNTFDKSNGRYEYSEDGEDGFRFEGSNNPLFVRTIYREGRGDIIWGALKTEKEVKEIKITFIDKKKPGNEISMSVPIVNNAFIGYPPVQLYHSEIEAATKWAVHAVVVDSNDSVAMERTYE
jgi:hypothetical protein